MRAGHVLTDLRFLLSLDYVFCFWCALFGLSSYKSRVFHSLHCLDLA